MISLNQKTKTRTSAFFGQWHNCALFYIPEAHVLRTLNHDSIDKSIWHRRQWHTRSVNFGGSWYNRSREITDEMVENLHKICDFLDQDSSPRRLTVYSDHVYVYANDVSLFDRMSHLDGVELIETVQIELSGNPGTVTLKNPQHKLRTYFRNCRLESKTAESMYSFLSNQSSIRLSPSLKSCAEHNYRYIQDHYFVDHDDLGTIMMLKMICPGLIRKTMPIEPAK